VDAAALDGVVAELRERLLGRRLARTRVAEAHALVVELAADREKRLWLDCARGQAGLYLLDRDDVRSLVDDGAATAATRRAALLFQKHLVGRRVSDLRRLAGERTIVLEAGDATVALRLSGTPASTLAVAGNPLVTLGAGREVWPLPESRTEREPSSPAPANARPTLNASSPVERWHDADLASSSAVTLDAAAGAGTVIQPATWIEAAALFLRARVRGGRFDRHRKIVLAECRREARRLSRLEAHLSQDMAGMPDAAALRRQGEALLSAPSLVPAGVSEASVPDPYDPENVLRVALDARLSGPANADRLFKKARRVDRGRRHIEARLGETRRALEDARAREARALEARDLSDLEPVRASSGVVGETKTRQPRRYLTSRGLALLVGRGARENHELTFTTARPEDVWLHARDVPGAHVILRDDEGRAVAADLREAAEVAAFFSNARAEARVDVHVTRRKHVRPARGGPGRVHVSHSDTLRVAPRDPEGRLRRR